MENTHMKAIRKAGMIVESVCRPPLLYWFVLSDVDGAVVANVGLLPVACKSEGAALGVPSAMVDWGREQRRREMGEVQEGQWLGSS